MVWSANDGVSIILPTDHVDGDGRNYIVIGEDVPSEITDKFTAAIVIANGKPDAPGSMYGFDYWYIGIDTSGNLDFGGLVYQDVSSGQNQFQHYRQSVLSIVPPQGMDQPPTLQLATGAYAEKGQTALYAATQFKPIPIPVTFTDNTWSNWGGAFEPLEAYLMVDGSVRIAGVIKCSNGPLGNGWYAFHVPPTYAPADSIPVPVYFGGGVSSGGAQLRSDGVFYFDQFSASVPANMGIHINFTYFPRANV